MKINATKSRTRHFEEHFTSSQSVSDIVIGMSDGLTVPFALAAGLTGAVAASKLVVTAGLAEVVAGSIAMGLGGYLAGRSQVEHYASEKRREEIEVVEKPNLEKQEVQELLLTWGLTEDEAEPVVEALSRRSDAWVDFMMRFELGLEEPDPKRALKSAYTIAGAYIVGGLIPLAPYMVFHEAIRALPYSVATTLIALFGFGFIKGIFIGTSRWKSAWQTVVIGGLAAAAAFGIAYLITSV